MHVLRLSNVICYKTFFVLLYFFSDEKPLFPFGILLSGPPGAGKRTVARATSRKLNMHFLGVSCYELIGESVAATEARLKNLFQKGLYAALLSLVLFSSY